VGKIIHVIDGSRSIDSKRFEKFSTVSSKDIVVRIAGMCNGNAQVLNDIRRALHHDTIDALIFYSHGAPGIQGVATGTDKSGVVENAAITNAFATISSWSQLRKNFSAKGVVVLRGCNTGRGERGDGLMKALARALNVPVVASDWYQPTGRTELVGNIRTARPDGTITENRTDGLKNLMHLPAIEQIAIIGAQVFGSP
jgi:hypothetical protein